MKHLTLRPTNQILYLLSEIKRAYENPTLVQLLCDALSYVCGQQIDWKNTFATLTSAEFVKRCNKENYPDPPAVLHFALSGEDEARYLQVEREICAAGVTSRPQTIAIVKAALYEYTQHLATATPGLPAEAGTYDAGFDDLSLNQKLTLLNAKLDLLALQVRQMLTLVQR